MFLDIILFAALIVWAVFGYRKGFVKQIFVLAGIVAVVFLGPPVSDIAQKVLQNEFGIVVAGRILHGLLFAGCSSLIYIIFYTIGYFLHDTLVKGIPVAERTNHILGATLGVLEAIFASYLILGVMAVGAAKIEEYAPAVHFGIKQSVAYQVVARNNLYEHFDYFKPILMGKQPGQNKSDKTASETADVKQPVNDNAVQETKETAEKHEGAGAVPVKTVPADTAIQTGKDVPSQDATAKDSAAKDSAASQNGGNDVSRRTRFQRKVN